MGGPGHWSGVLILGPASAREAPPRWTTLLVGVLALAAGCTPPDEYEASHYVAIVTKVDARGGAGVTTPLQYHIYELSGTLGFDTTIVTAASDTVILEVAPATYRVALAGHPERCPSRHGTLQQVVVSEATGTAITRWYLECEVPLLLDVYAGGLQVDDAFVWVATSATNAGQSGVIAANDTVAAMLPPGEWLVELRHVAGNCVVVSDGGAERRVVVAPTGGARLTFLVNCNDPAREPRFVTVGGSIHDGAALIAFRAVDPNRDVERYWLDVTDCHRTSLLGGARLRRGLSDGRTYNADTVDVVAGLEVGLPDSTLQGACVAIRVADEYGNTTPVAEFPAAGLGGRRPAASSFNAIYSGVSAVRTTFGATDPDGDYAGYFVTARLRDGILGPVDGAPDIGVWNAAGYLIPPVPDLVFDGQIGYGDVYAVILYLADRRGNFTRLEDADLLH